MSQVVQKARTLRVYIHVLGTERVKGLCNHSNGNLLAWEKNVMFTCEITCYVHVWRHHFLKARLVFHWCSYNKLCFFRLVRDQGAYIRLLRTMLSRFLCTSVFFLCVVFWKSFQSSFWLGKSIAALWQSSLKRTEIRNNLSVTVITFKWFLVAKTERVRLGDPTKMADIQTIEWTPREYSYNEDCEN